MINVIKNLTSTVGPFLQPTRSNLPRLMTLISYIALSILQSKHANSCYDRIDAATQFFKSDNFDKSQFSNTFREAFTHGFLPYISMEIGTSWLCNKSIVTLREGVLRNLLSDWLRAIQKETPPLSIQNPEKILADDCSDVVDLTIGSIQKVMRAVQIIFTTHRVYKLASPLYHTSLPVPLNHSGGLFSIIIGVMGLMTLIQAVFQKFLASSRKKAHESRLVVNSLAWIEANRAQIISLPRQNSDRVAALLNNQVSQALRDASSVQMGFVLQEQISYILPTLSELLASLIPYTFIGKMAEEIDLKQTLPILLGQSIRLLWQFSYFVQGLMNNQTSFSLALDRIIALRKAISDSDSTSCMARADKLELDKVSAKNGTTSTFENLSINLPLGQIYYIAGENGSGKTTFCRTVKGIEKGVTGSLSCPHEVIYLQKDFSIRSSIQSFKSLLKSHFGIEDEVATTAIKERLKEFDSYYKNESFVFPELNNDESKDWSTLSAGEIQILSWSVMLGLAHKKSDESCLLIGDEALSNLSLKSRDTMTNILKAWIKENPEKRGLILVEHSKNLQSLQTVNYTGSAAFSIYTERV